MTDIDIHERPTVSPYGAVEDRTLRFIESFGRRVSRSPDVYLQAIAALGEAATQNSIALAQVDEHLQADLIDSRELDPKQFMLHFFAERHDYDAVFNPETEEALKVDEGHKKLQERHAAMSRRNKMAKGELRKGASEEAIEARDAVRRNRVQFFVQRVKTWKILEQDTLPSTG